MEGKRVSIQDCNHNTLDRIARVIKLRRAQGQNIALEHVYSHQEVKLKTACKQGFKGRDKANNILAGNARLRRLYPEVVAYRGNQKADKLANKGRISDKANIIPEGMEAFIVQDTKDLEVLSNTQIKNKITMDIKS